MAGNPTDRRVQKTRKLLQDTLISLIAEKGFDAVTIKDLLDRANVGRSTFYLHFDNKDELLHSCFEEFNNSLNQHYSEILHNAKQETDDILFIAGFFRFVEKKHDFFKALMGEYGVGMFNKGIHDYAFEYLGRMIKKQDVHKRLNPVKADMLTHYVTNAFIGVLQWWVKSDLPCTANEVSQYVIRQTAVNFKEALQRL